MSETNIFEIENFCVYFENQPEQLGAFKRNMHEQTCVDIHFDAGRLSPQYGLWSMARMKKQNEKHENE